MQQNNANHQSSPRFLEKFRDDIHEIIFEADTPLGKWFDVILLILIVMSVLAVMLESVKVLDQQYHEIFFYTEWTLTIVFTIEYLLRIFVVLKPWKYISSFFGIVDLLAILPTYLSLIISGSQYLLTIRAIRLLRIFRIFKLARFLVEGEILMTALRNARQKIIVFLGTVITIVIIIGSMMYMVEGEHNGFTNIPKSMYWAVVTLTTVGYGDITPQTGFGQFISAVLMITGYAIIAVPTGIFSAELIHARTNKKLNTISCISCGYSKHETDAVYCIKCGHKLKNDDDKNSA